MEVKIKFATPENLKDIQKLNLLLFEKEYEEYDKLLNLDWTFGAEGSNFFKDKISRDNGCVLIAEVDNKIVGYLAGGLNKAESYRNLPLVAELDNTFILEDYRNLGIGSQLHKKFIEWCKSKDVKLVRVQASIQNEQAISFYREKGFKDYTLILESKI